MGKKITKIILAISLFSFSFSAFLSVHRAVSLPDSSTWILPIIFFSLFFIALFLSIVLIRESRIIFGILFLALATNLFFAFELIRLIFCGLGFLIMFFGIRKIRRDLELNVRFDFGKILTTGKSLMVLAMVILIVGQYYSEVKRYHIQNLPQLKLDKVIGMVVPSALSIISPDFKNLQDEYITVDEFILNMQKSQTGSLLSSKEAEIDKLIEEKTGGQATPLQKKILKEAALNSLSANVSGAEELILAEGRRQLSELSGDELSGQEKISAVFSDVVNNQINDFVTNNIENGEGVPILPAIFAGVLFLMLIPLGNFLSWFWMIIAIWIFNLFLRLKIVNLTKVLIEVERLE